MSDGGIRQLAAGLLNDAWPDATLALSGLRRGRDVQARGATSPTRTAAATSAPSSTG